MTHHPDVTAIEQRRNSIREWLADEAPYVVADQRQLDAHTPERAYWHFGYQAALTDVLDLLTNRAPTSGTEDTAN